MNVKIPQNNRTAEPAAPYNYFWGILALNALMAFGVWRLVSHWRRAAKRKHQKGVKQLGRMR